MAAERSVSRRVGRVSGIGAALVSLAVLPVWAGVTPANAAATLTVCAHGCGYSQVSAAVAAAHDGDTVVVGPGTYAGGFAITASVTVVGVGAGRTTIAGGGPVITVGTYLAAAEPTVAIRGVTITGGDVTSFEGDTNFARGGGILVPPGAAVGPTEHPYYFDLGATLTVTDSVVTRNVAEPATSGDLGPCGAVDCRFAGSDGGGIDSWGSVTVERSSISQNTAGGVSSDADGGGVNVKEGPFVLDHSLLIGNKAQPDPAIGRFAEGGAIFTESSFPDFSSLTVRSSVVSNNSAAVTSTLPAFAGTQQIEAGVNAGGIHVGDNVPTTITDSVITGNSATASDPQGEIGSIDGAINVGDSPLTMSRTVISGNTSTTTAQTTADIGPQGDIVEVDGAATIDHTSIVGNFSRVTTPDGTAQNAAALGIFNFNNDPALVTVSSSSISNNVAEASSTTGTATVAGGGVINDSLLQMNDVHVGGNVALAVGVGGFAEGGGVWNGVDISGPPVTLTLDRVAITGNTAAGSPGLTLQGGGLYTTFPVALTRTAIVGNRPDQCFGCSPATASKATVTRPPIAKNETHALSRGWRVRP